MDEANNAPNDNENPEAAANTTDQRTGGAARTLDAKLSGPLAPLEVALDGVFGKKAPYQLPADMKDLLVKVAPWLSLISGILGILSAMSLWRAAHYVNKLSEAFGVSGYVDTVQLSVSFWLSLAALLLFSVLAFLAFPGLKAKKKIGWNLMFYSMLANIVYGVISLFYNASGFGALLTALIMSAVGFYILFQIRDRYRA